jgi:HD-GYP domain-containing protein (c-di-GMP phosphodiesterase class II)
MEKFENLISFFKKYIFLISMFFSAIFLNFLYFHNSKFFILNFSVNIFYIFLYPLLLLNLLVFIFYKVNIYHSKFLIFGLKESEEKEIVDKNFFLNIKDNWELKYLIDNIALNIKEVLELDGCLIYILENTFNKYYLRADNRYNQNNKKDSFSKNNFLIKLLIENKRIILKKELEQKKDEKNFNSVYKNMDFLSAEICMPIMFNENLIGFIFLSKKADNTKFQTIDFNILKLLNLEISLTLNTAISYNDLKRNYLQTIDALVMTLEAKDENTKGHSERVQYLAIEIAKYFKCSKQEVDILRSESILNEIGKIAIENRVLNKIDTENVLQKSNSIVEKEIISPVDFFADIKHVITQHNEKYDQSYSDVIDEKKIIFLSKILHIADNFDSIINLKTERKSKTIKEAIFDLKYSLNNQNDIEIIKALDVIFEDAIY